MNQGIDFTFARKPGASIQAAAKLAASIKERLPFPLGITFGGCSASESSRHAGFIQFESLILLPINNPNEELAEVVQAIHAILKEEGWELYDAKTAALKSQPSSQPHPKGSPAPQPQQKTQEKKWWEFWK